MPIDPSFRPDEYAARVGKARAVMTERELDVLLVSSPENIYYLVGINHAGYFAVIMLVLPRQEDPFVVVRRVETDTINDQCPGLRVEGFGDDDDPAEAIVAAIRAAGLARARIGMEKDHMFLPVRVGERVQGELTSATWADCSGIIDELRLVKSPAELAYTRQAAAVSDRLMRSGIEAAGAGVNEKEVVAEIYRAMILSGAEPPGFPPLVRSTEMLDWGHRTWRDRMLRAGDALFVETAGCIRRYHAPIGRLVYIGRAPESAKAAEPVVLEGMAAMEQALRPGVLTGEVYAAWQEIYDRAAGTPQPIRHHVGYLTGVGFPPSWVGGSEVRGIRPNGTIRVQEGMVFHLMSWLVGSVIGDYFVSDTAVITAEGCEILTCTPRELIVR